MVATSRSPFRDRQDVATPATRLFATARVGLEGRAIERQQPIGMTSSLNNGRASRGLPAHDKCDAGDPSLPTPADSAVEPGTQASDPFRRDARIRSLCSTAYRRGRRHGLDTISGVSSFRDQENWRAAQIPAISNGDITGGLHCAAGCRRYCSPAGTRPVIPQAPQVRFNTSACRAPCLADSLRRHCSGWQPGREAA